VVAKGEVLRGKEGTVIGGGLRRQVIEKGVSLKIALSRLMVYKSRGEKARSEG